MPLIKTDSQRNELKSYAVCHVIPKTFWLLLIIIRLRSLAIQLVNKKKQRNCFTWKLWPKHSRPKKEKRRNFSISRCRCSMSIFSMSISFVQVNQTNQDWHLAATLEGEGFYGPPVMVAKSHLTTSYPLMFKPCYEGQVEVGSYTFSLLRGNYPVMINTWFIHLCYSG